MLRYPLPEIVSRMAQSTRGEALPWIDAQGQVIQEHAESFAGMLDPQGGHLNEAGIVAARIVWESLSEREKKMGRALSFAPDRLAEWLLQGTSIMGLDPALAPWRDSQRQARLAVLLAQGWRPRSDLQSRQAFAKTPTAEPEQTQAWRFGRGSWLGRGIVGRVAFCAVSNAAFLIAGALAGCEAVALFATGRPTLASFLPWAIGALVSAGSGVALPILAHSRLRMQGGAPLLWPVARALLPLAQRSATLAAEAAANSHWGQFGELSRLDLAAVSPEGFDRKTPFGLASRLSQKKNFSVASFAKTTPREDQEIRRLAATLSLDQMIAREESAALAALLAQPPSSAAAAQSLATPPRRKARAL